jgi:hypothetical protein
LWLGMSARNVPLLLLEHTAAAMLTQELVRIDL